MLNVSISNRIILSTSINKIPMSVREIPDTHLFSRTSNKNFEVIATRFAISSGEIR